MCPTSTSSTPVTCKNVCTVICTTPPSTSRAESFVLSCGRERFSLRVGPGTLLSGSRLRAPLRLLAPHPRPEPIQGPSAPLKASPQGMVFFWNRPRTHVRIMIRRSKPGNIRTPPRPLLKPQWTQPPHQKRGSLRREAIRGDRSRSPFFLIETDGHGWGKKSSGGFAQQLSQNLVNFRAACISFFVLAFHINVDLFSIEKDSLPMTPRHKHINFSPQIRVICF